MTRSGPGGAGSLRRPTRTVPMAATPPGSPRPRPPTPCCGPAPAGRRRWPTCPAPRGRDRAAVGRPAAAGEGRRRRPAAGLVAGRWWSRVRRGRPARLALRIAATAAVSAGVVVAAGTRPATPALITGALTWLVLTARHDLAPPQ